jgi:hypothetical protein
MTKMFDDLVATDESVNPIFHGRAAAKAQENVTRFDVTDLWKDLSDDHWQEQVRPLLETTPCRPPYVDSWWEWGTDTPSFRAESARRGMPPERVRCGVLLLDAEPAEAMEYLSVRVEHRSEIDDVWRQVRGGGVARIAVGIMLMQRGMDFFVTGLFGFAMDERGHFIRMGEGFFVVANAHANTINPTTEQQWATQHLIINTAWQVAYFNSMLHVRNVIAQRHEIPERLNAARRKRERGVLHDFHTLHIVTPAQARAHARGERVDFAQMRAHTVRGFYRTYTEERPMLGKPWGHGTFWVPAFTRGNKELGTAAKEYRVSPRKEAVHA